MSLSISVKKCSRCNDAFVCNPANISACQCSGVSFTEEERVLLSQMHFDDCLCLACLKELKIKAGEIIAAKEEDRQ